MFRITCLLFGLTLVFGCGDDDGGDTGPMVDSGSGTDSGGGTDSGSGADSGGGTDAGGMCGPFATPATIDEPEPFFCVAAGSCDLKVGDCDPGVISEPDELLFSLHIVSNMASVDEVELRISNTDDYVVSSTEGDVRFNANPGNWVECDAEPMTCDTVRQIPVDTETTVVTNRHRVTFTYSSTDETYTVTEFVAL